LVITSVDHTRGAALSERGDFSQEGAEAWKEFLVHEKRCPVDSSKPKIPFDLPVFQLVSSDSEDAAEMEPHPHTGRKATFEQALTRCGLVRMCAMELKNELSDRSIRASTG
jgi:hypothetical protein